jgi:uncharacterized paraquat-inducible protein A
MTLACLLRATIGMYLTGLHLMSVHLMGVHLTGVHLTVVHLKRVHFMNVYLIGAYRMLRSLIVYANIPVSPQFSGWCNPQLFNKLDASCCVFHIRCHQPEQRRGWVGHWCIRTSRVNTGIARRRDLWFHHPASQHKGSLP